MRARQLLHERITGIVIRRAWSIRCQSRTPGVKAAANALPHRDGVQGHDDIIQFLTTNLKEEKSADKTGSLRRREPQGSELDTRQG